MWHAGFVDFQAGMPIRELPQLLLARKLIGLKALCYNTTRRPHFMAYQFPPDIDKRMQEHLASGNFENEDYVLREAMGRLDQSRADHESIERGISDMQAGRVRPAADSNAEFRLKHQIPQN